MVVTRVAVELDRPAGRFDLLAQSFGKLEQHFAVACTMFHILHIAFSWLAHLRWRVQIVINSSVSVVSTSSLFL